MRTQPSLWGVPATVAKRHVAPAQLIRLRVAAVAVAILLLVSVYEASYRLPWYTDGALALAAAFGWAYKFERHTR